MKTKSIERFMNENMICIAYCMKAIKLPTCMLDWATMPAPTQMINT